MQQRQPRLGDILDDYCPRERRLTNHAVVAMVGDDVKQTRCTTCDSEHEYKHAKVPRPRRSPAPAALTHGAPSGPKKRVAQEAAPSDDPQAVASTNGSMHEPPESEPEIDEEMPMVVRAEGTNGEAISGTEWDATDPDDADEDADKPIDVEEGPVHRPLIRATLPRQEGQAPPTRPAPEFTIRQPAGRPNRFRARHGAPPFQHQRSAGQSGNGNGPARGGMPRQGSGRPPGMPRTQKRHNSGRKRSK